MGDADERRAWRPSTPLAPGPPPDFEEDLRIGRACLYENGRPGYTPRPSRLFGGRVFEFHSAQRRSFKLSPPCGLQIERRACVGFITMFIWPLGEIQWAQ